jgi:hypothetical protein
MWRTLFMAFGLYIFLLGAQCLVVDKFVMKSRTPAAPSTTNWLGQTEKAQGTQREFVPTEWAPWSFMSGGSVLWLYAVAISGRMKK